MRRLAWCAAAAMTPALASAASEAADQLSATVTGSYYAMRDQPDFGVAVAAVNRGPFRIEARYNYEARDATSAFVGWKWAGGETLTYEVTPIVGGLWGSTRGVVPGVEASVAYKNFDAYVEAEYVFDRDASSSNYFYAWSELGWRPSDWLRIGLAGQRTRVVRNDRDLQRGVFAQLTLGRLSVALYAFNPDAGSRYTIATVALGF